jgi:hypothetical protein
MHNKNLIYFIVFLLAFHSGYSQTLSSLSHLQNKISFVNDGNIKSAFKNQNKVKLSLINLYNNNKSITIIPADKLNIEKTYWREAAEYAKSDEPKLFGYLTSVAKYPELFPPNFDSKDENVRNLSYIVLALQSKNDIEDYFTDTKITNDEDKKQIYFFINDIISSVKKIGKPTVSLFASGDIVGSISNQGTQGTPNQSTIGTGSVGVRYVTNKNIVLAKVYIASSQDTLKNNFGQSLLSPAKGEALGSALIEWYHATSLKELGNPWIHAYGSVASSLWNLDSTNSNTLTRSASILGIGVLLNWPVFNGKIANTDAGLNLELGCSLRYFGGDIRNFLNSGSDSASFIKAFPTRKNTFIGPEFGMSINIGDVSAAIQAYVYSGKKGEQINGLTRLQFSFGISINASVISGALD